MTDLIVRFAESDPDVVAIHGFLVVTMWPLLPIDGPGDIDPKNSATEVWNVVNHGCALMAMQGDLLVGTIGIVKAPFWWGHDRYFLANRWLSVLPDSGALDPLMREVIGFAKGLGLELHVYDEQKGRIKILNRDPRRRESNPFLTMPPATHVATSTLQ